LGEEEGEVMFYTPITFDETNPFGWVDVIAVPADDYDITCNEVMTWGVEYGYEAGEAGFRADLLTDEEHAQEVLEVDEKCCSTTPLPYQNGEGGEDYNPTNGVTTSDDELIEVVFEAAMTFDNVVVPTDPAEKSFMLSVLAQAIASSSGSDSVVIISIDGVDMMASRRLASSDVVFEATVVVVVPEGQTAAAVATATADQSTAQLNEVVTSGDFAQKITLAAASVIEKAEAEGTPIPAAVQTAVAASIAVIVPGAVVLDTASVASVAVAVDGEDPSLSPTPVPTEDTMKLSDSAGFTAKAGSISFAVATVAAMLM